MARAKAALRSDVASSSSSSTKNAPPPTTVTDFPSQCALPPLRHHTDAYHNALLLRPPPLTEGDVNLKPGADAAATGLALLDWYQGVATGRGMPWRKAWIDPESDEYQGKEGRAKLRTALEKRAYEVWISEIMLQQTRVATVIDYWNSWTQRWPTIQDLAKASPDDVLSAWRGLGYYSRATRIHQAAQKVVDDEELQGLLPSTALELEKQVPGVGRYTAGAISSIVFGRAAAILDGNVARVLSRQLALNANPKNKTTTDLLWQVAQTLIEAVAGFSQDSKESSEKPSLWNQALMELGSTVCTPQQPRCVECPIRSTCRAYGEGERLAIAKRQMSAGAAIFPQPPSSPQDVEDIEDLCGRCEPLVSMEEGDGSGGGEEDSADTIGGAGTKRKASSSSAPVKKQQTARQQSSLLNHFAKRKPETASNGVDVSASVEPSATIPSAALQTIQDHVRLFPMKVVKAKVREEECLVCAVQVIEAGGGKVADSQWLLHQRPAKGLLASLWDFPTMTLAPSDSASASSQQQRKKSAIAYVKSLPDVKALAASPVCKGELGSIDHVFSHLKLKMWVWRFVVVVQQCDGSVAVQEKSKGGSEDGRRKWSSTAQVEAESMGTGMRNCWALVQEAAKWK